MDNEQEKKKKIGRPRKYKEGRIVRSMNIPISLDKKIEEIAKREGKSKNNLIVSLIMAGMNKEDLSDIIYDIESKFMIENKQNKSEQYNIIINNIDKVIFEYSVRIANVKKEHGTQHILDVFPEIVYNRLKEKMIKKSIMIEDYKAELMLEIQKRIMNMIGD